MIVGQRACRGLASQKLAFRQTNAQSHDGIA
jgi:hypothetical protein